MRQPPATAAAAPRAFLTQEMFDQVVEENVQEFSMTLEEARLDAVQQLSRTGRLDAVAVTEEAVAARARVVDLGAALDELTAENWSALEADVKEHSCVRFKAVELGLLSKALRAPLDCLPAWTVAAALAPALYPHKALSEDLSQAFGVEAWKVLLGMGESQPQTLLAALEACRALCVASEVTKEELNRTLSFSDSLRAIVSSEVFQSNRDILLATSKLIRVYLTDDDLREDVSPHTFIRARELGETGPFLSQLSRQFQRLATENSVSLTEDVGATLQTVCVNDPVCERATSSECGLLDVLMALLAELEARAIKSEEEMALMQRACALVKTLASHDGAKKRLGKSEGGSMLLSLSRAHHLTHPKIALESLSALSSIALRQPEISARLIDEGFLDLLLDVLNTKASTSKPSPGLLKTSLLACHNVISDKSNFAHRQTLVDRGARELIQEVQKEFPAACGDAAGMVLRDLEAYKRKN